jgi:hypothetical protein
MKYFVSLAVLYAFVAAAYFVQDNKWVASILFCLGFLFSILCFFKKSDKIKQG